MATAKTVVVVLHTVPVQKLQHAGFAHGVPHNVNTPFAVVLWDTVSHKVTKIVKRYVTADGALNAAKRLGNGVEATLVG
jgi:hypothetical protein